MSERDFDPLRLDVAALAKAAGELGGKWPLGQFVRLAGSVVRDAAPADHVEVSWQARGELRPMRGGEAEVWLHVAASTNLTVECQRCLRGVDVALSIERRFLFVHGEDSAAQLDADSEDDVMALTRALDLGELIEDELLLALPLVPRHEVCPIPLQAPLTESQGPDFEKPNPFAVLAVLKPPGRSN